MPAFSFDDGGKSVDVRIPSGWECIVRDKLPADHTEADYLKAAADQIISDIWSKKLPATVRRCFRLSSGDILRMSEEAPADFDRVISEFAERLTLLAEAPEQSGDPAHSAQSDQQRKADHDLQF